MIIYKITGAISIAHTRAKPAVGARLVHVSACTRMPSLSMLTTCRVIFFIISAGSFRICIKRKCLYTRRGEITSLGLSPGDSHPTRPRFYARDRILTITVEIRVLMQRGESRQVPSAIKVILLYSEYCIAKVSIKSTHVEINLEEKWTLNSRDIGIISYILPFLFFHSYCYRILFADIYLVYPSINNITNIF